MHSNTFFLINIQFDNFGKSAFNYFSNFVTIENNHKTLT